VVQSEHSPEPLTIRSSEVERLDFTVPDVATQPAEAMVYLRHGDRVPGRVTGMNAQHVNLMSPALGMLEIPRRHIAQVQLGIRPQELIIDGFGETSTWKVEDDWKFENDQLVSLSRGRISRDLGDLPDAFSIAFQLDWNQRPSLNFFFCGPTGDDKEGLTDQYFLHFDRTGINLHRQSSESGESPLLGVVPIRLEALPDSSVLLEIRVDRASRMIQLFIDGSFAGRFPDQVDSVVPKGGGLSFQSLSSSREAHRISHLRVHRWDASRDRHRSEERGDPALDAVIDHGGQRFSGIARELKDRAGGSFLIFETPLLDQAMEIPLTKISTLFFRETSASATTTPFVLEFANEGRLSTEVASFDGGEIRLTHPFLGELEVSRDHIRSLVRQDVAETSPTRKPKEEEK
jgi:hypothetical protein